MPRKGVPGCIAVEPCDGIIMFVNRVCMYTFARVVRVAAPAAVSGGSTPAFEMLVSSGEGVEASNKEVKNIVFID